MAKCELKALHCTVWKDRRLVFKYGEGRWQILESFWPWDIREALKVALEKIEESVPHAPYSDAALVGARLAPQSAALWHKINCRVTCERVRA